MKAKAFLITLTLLLIFTLLCSCQEPSDIPSEQGTHVTEDTESTPSTTSGECNHRYGEWRTIVKPTCILDGLEKRDCLLCDKTLERTLPATEHVPVKTIHEPDCTNEGYTECVCECGYSYRTEIVAPTGHALKKETTPPTCTEQGNTKYSCENCSYSYVGDFTPPTEHNLTHTYRRPTVITPGYTEHTCDCSFSYRDSYVFYSDILENAYCSDTEILANGMDVSRWNHNQDADGNYLPLDWNVIKAQGIEFVIIKAGSSKSGIEPTFSMDYEGARAAGLEIGAYFYTYATTIEDIRAEAELLLSALEGKQFEYPIYLDMEDPSLEGLGKNYLSDMCEAFAVTLQENGYYAAIYSNHNWLTNILDSAKIFSLYDVWYARYPLTEKPTWNEEKYGKQLGMWQYTDSGKIDGVDTLFDFNYAYKDYSEIMKKWGLNGF